jgi:hypothetical protein
MTTHAAPPTTVDSIKNSLVALRMPRALEMLDVTLRRIEQGEKNREGFSIQDPIGYANAASGRFLSHKP